MHGSGAGPVGQENMITATLIGYDAKGNITHQDTRSYPDLTLVWEHVGAQQNNRKTVRVNIQTDCDIAYDVKFSSWTPQRQYKPTRRFVSLLGQWCGDFVSAK